MLKVKVKNLRTGNSFVLGETENSRYAEYLKSNYQKTFGDKWRVVIDSESKGEVR